MGRILIFQNLTELKKLEREVRMKEKWPRSASWRPRSRTRSATRSR